MTLVFGLDKAVLSFRLRAAWFLGKDKDDRKRLLAVLKKIYDYRSTIVHGGELKKRDVTIDKKTIPMSELIADAQDLCQKSIVKILKKYSEDGKYPDKEVAQMLPPPTSSGKFGAALPARWIA